MSVLSLRLKCLWTRLCILLFKLVGNVRKKGSTRFFLRTKKETGYVETPVHVDIEIIECTFVDTSSSLFLWNTTRYTVSGGSRTTDKRRTYYGLSTDEFSKISVYDYPNLKFMVVSTEDE